jgi:hypothetical protein
MALNRIPHRNVALMAYVGQLLLHSTRPIKEEVMNAQGYSTWCKVSRKALTEKLPQLPPPKSALPVDLRQDLIEEGEEIVEGRSDEHRQEGNFAQEAEAEYEVSEPPGIDPSSHNEEYDAKNNESRWLAHLKAFTQVLHPNKL